MNMSGIQTGDYALISGAGAMGIIHVLLAKLRGAKVIVSEPTKKDVTEHWNLVLITW